MKLRVAYNAGNFLNSWEPVCFSGRTLLHRVSKYEMDEVPNPVEAAWSKAWVWGFSLAGIAGSNPAGGMDVFRLSVMCCHVEVSASGWQLVQRSATECGVSECDREAEIMRPWPTRRCCAMGKNKSGQKCALYFICMDNYGFFLSLKSRQIFMFIIFNKTLFLPKLKP
jgi:hypothetical protein